MPVRMEARTMERTIGRRSMPLEMAERDLIAWNQIGRK